MACLLTQKAYLVKKLEGHSRLYPGPRFFETTVKFVKSNQMNVQNLVQFSEKSFDNLFLSNSTKFEK